MFKLKSLIDIFIQYPNHDLIQTLEIKTYIRGLARKTNQTNIKLQWDLNKDEFSGGHLLRIRYSFDYTYRVHGVSCTVWLVRRVLLMALLISKAEKENVQVSFVLRSFAKWSGRCLFPITKSHLNSFRTLRRSFQLYTCKFLQIWTKCEKEVSKLKRRCRLLLYSASLKTV